MNKLIIKDVSIINEFTVVYTLTERYYLDKRGDQRAHRTLQCQDNVICTEDHLFGLEKGELARLVRVIDELSGTFEQCAECRYKIGQYTGDPGYLLYVIFKIRIRTKFLKFKYRLTHLNLKNRIFGRKTTRSSKIDSPE